MPEYICKIAVIASFCAMMSSCAVVKTTGTVAALPFKTAYKTTELVGKSVIATGKGIYYVGTVPVKVTDKALDTSSKMLMVTTQALDASGKAITVTRKIKAAQLGAELSAVRMASNILAVTIDAAQN